MIRGVHTDEFDKFADQFPDSYIPILIKLILSTWKSFSTSETNETKISRQFFTLLAQQQESCRLPFLIDYEIPYPKIDGSSDIGRLDYRFIHGHRRKVYFSLECKRLHVTFPDDSFATLATGYVKEGMYRYFNGQYAVDLNKGGMLGYVMDGDITKAKANVKKAIEQHREKLHMPKDGTIGRSDIVKDRRVFQTKHLPMPQESFTIHHILLAVH